MAAADTPQEPYNELLKLIFNGDIQPGAISEEFVTTLAEHYMEAVFNGFGKDFSGIAWDTPDHAMLRNLEKNVYQFAGAKNYTELRELTNLLVDDTSIKTLSQFKKAAEAVLGEYSRYIETEYNSAIAGAQMAGKWVSFQQSEDDGNLVLLQYQTVGDQRVREQHAELDGTIKERNSSFWDKYYPPNGWNCRCTVVQLPENAPETPDADIPHPDIPALWAVNTAKQNVVFPKNSPYFKEAPKEILKQAAALAPNQKKPTNN
ncbi:MAG: hypothetical protein EBZ77_02565 [Chitinophagia bacterium]|nr:hypothetical protein [Chitinophagia bacterium]